MLPGQSSLKAIRDAQRIRSLNNLKGQQRLRHNSTSSASGASSSSSSGLSARSRVRGARAPQSKSLSSTAAARAELAEEIQEARGELEDAGLGSSEERAPVDVEAGCSELVRGGEEGTAVEVPLEELVVPGRRRHMSGEFELIRSVKGVIALAEDEFGAASAELGRDAVEEEDDEWELLGMDDDQEGPDKVKPQAKSWAGIVGRS